MTDKHKWEWPPPWTKGKWPKFAEHDFVRCFNCNAMLGGESYSSSGSPHGGGQFQKLCPNCRYFTWYDIGGRDDES